MVELSKRDRVLPRRVHSLGGVARGPKRVALLDAVADLTSARASRKPADEHNGR